MENGENDTSINEAHDLRRRALPVANQLIYWRCKDT